MFERSIEFHGPESIIHDKEILPIPANKNIPAWYRDLEPHTNIGNSHGRGVGTLKKCLPVLDALTAGYILKSHQDVFINFNFFNYFFIGLFLFLFILICLFLIKF